MLMVIVKLTAFRQDPRGIHWPKTQCYFRLKIWQLFIKTFFREIRVIKMLTHSATDVSLPPDLLISVVKRGIILII